MLRKIVVPQGGGGGAKLVTPSANSYFDAIGTVDMREQGGYFDHVGGTVALFIDAPPSQQGGYFNRT